MNGVVSILAGIYLANQAMGQAWAIGLLGAGIIVVLIVAGFVSGVAERDAFIVAVALAVIVCLGLALNGGGAAIILEALGGRVTSTMAWAATLTGVGGVLSGIGSVLK
ncbi:MAG: hypothetical protein IT342_25155 [Candidatus Melainabacteria bacterium]|nr:hypothetical protein [Candidatus Melainabacteria bacterium]